MVIFVIVSMVIILVINGFQCGVVVGVDVVIGVGCFVGEGGVSGLVFGLCFRFGIGLVFVVFFLLIRVLGSFVLDIVIGGVVGSVGVGLRFLK